MVRNAALSWWRLVDDSYSLWLDSMAVIAMRTEVLVTGAPGFQREAARMVSEKIAAGGELAVALAAAGNASPERAARQAVKLYGAKVRANRRRLARRKS
jgi:hypothetical protein